MPAMPTWRLTLEYDGTRYSGWQSQTNTGRTIQGQLQAAAAELLGRTSIGGAGRTDAGVHAAAQVAHLRCSVTVRPRDLQYGLNDLLPHDIHVLKAERAAEEFHARHDAISRIYLYQIATRRTAFAKPYVWWIRDRLDAAAMDDAASLLHGRHDFAGFADKRAGGGPTEVVVDRAEVGSSGDLILVRIGASHFLWRMVRKLVAALVEVGTGRLAAEEFASILRSRTRFEPSAPPSGLFLEAVLYEGDAFRRGMTPIIPVVTPRISGREP